MVGALVLRPRVTLFNFALALQVFLYFIVPGLACAYGAVFSIGAAEDGVNIQAYVLSLLGLGSFIFGAFLAGGFRLRTPKGVDVTARRFKPLAVFWLILGLFGVVLFAQSGGGLAATVRDAGLIRDSQLGYNDLSIFKHFIWITHFVLLWCICMPSERRDAHYWIITSVAAVAALVASLLGASRGSALSVVVCAVFAIGFGGNWLRVRWLWLLIWMPVFLIILLYGKTFANVMGTHDASFAEQVFETQRRTDQQSSSSSAIEAMLSDFSHPYYSLGRFWDPATPPQELRYGSDLWIAVASLIPSKVWADKPIESVAYPNTEMLYGERVGMIPPGLYGFGSFALGSLGVALTACLLGGLLILCDARCLQLVSLDASYRVVPGILSYYWVYFIVFNGDPRVILTTATFATLFIASLVWRSRRMPQMVHLRLVK